MIDEWIRQIAADPDDDKLRLVYADHLMQRGDPRGELVAVQIALAKHEATDDDAPVAKLAKRESDLLALHHDAWIMAPRAVLPRMMTFRRGFLEHVRLEDPHELVTAWPRLQPLVPLLRAIEVRRNLGALAQLPNIDEADVLYVPTNAEAQLLAGAESRLRILRLAANGIGDGTLVDLVEQRHALTELAFSIDRRPPRRLPILARLAAAPARKSLRTLRLRQVYELGELREVVRALPELEVLQIEATSITAPELNAIVADAPRLCELDISDDAKAQIDVVGVLAAGKRLRRLRLSGLGLTGAHATAIAGSPDAARLVRLDLRDNKISELGARLLLESEHAQQLKRINLNMNNLTPHAKQQLRQLPLVKRAHVSLR